MSGRFCQFDKQCWKESLKNQVFNTHPYTYLDISPPNLLIIHGDSPHLTSMLSPKESVSLNNHSLELTLNPKTMLTNKGTGSYIQWKLIITLLDTMRFWIHHGQGMAPIVIYYHIKPFFYNAVLLYHGQIGVIPWIPNIVL